MTRCSRLKSLAIAYVTFVTPFTYYILYIYIYIRGVCISVGSIGKGLFCGYKVTYSPSMGKVRGYASFLALTELTKLTNYFRSMCRKFLL